MAVESIYKIELQQPKFTQQVDDEIDENDQNQTMIRCFQQWLQIQCSEIFLKRQFQRLNQSIKFQDQDFSHYSINFILISPLPIKVDYLLRQKYGMGTSEIINKKLHYLLQKQREIVAMNKKNRLIPKKKKVILSKNMYHITKKKNIGVLNNKTHSLTKQNQDTSQSKLVLPPIIKARKYVSHINKRPPIKFNKKHNLLTQNNNQMILTGRSIFNRSTQ